LVIYSIHLIKSNELNILPTIYLILYNLNYIISYCLILLESPLGGCRHVRLPKTGVSQYDPKSFSTTHIFLFFRGMVIYSTRSNIITPVIGTKLINSSLFDMITYPPVWAPSRTCASPRRRRYRSYASKRLQAGGNTPPPIPPQWIGEGGVVVDLEILIFLVLTPPSPPMEKTVKLPKTGKIG